MKTLNSELDSSLFKNTGVEVVIAVAIDKHQKEKKAQIVYALLREEGLFMTMSPKGSNVVDTSIWVPVFDTDIGELIV